MALSFRNRQVEVLGTDAPEGFFGKVTASLDWCESNYDVTYYIAEFWNTVSNVAFIVPSLLAAYYVYRVRLERRFALAHLGVGLIGIGSAFFHMTLKLTMQLADELPMLYGTAILLYCVLEMHKPRSNGLNVPLALVLLVTTTVTSLAYIVNREPAIFFGCYSIYTILTISLGGRNIYCHGDRETRFIGFSAIGAYTLGFCLWGFENNNCAVVQQWRASLGALGVATQLHAWWHVFAAIGGYLLVVAFVHVRTLLLAGKPRVFYQLRVLPLITDDTAANGGMPSRHHITMTV